jgi:3-oxoadipate enol-lactonase
VTAVELHHTVDGPDDAPVLVLGPSLGTTTELWRGQMTDLAERLRVVRYDHRGHGGSPVPPGPYTLADLGGDVVALLDRLGLDRVHLGGMSLGGMVSMWVAANAPDRVDRLVLMCTSARLGPPEMWAERAAVARTQGVEALADATLARWLPEDLARSRPDVVAELRAMLTSTPAEGYAGCCAAIEHMDQVPDLPRIRAETLVIAGLADPATPPSHAEVIVTGIPNARLELIGGAAHLANVARPEVITKLVVSFLTTRTG